MFGKGQFTPPPAPAVVAAIPGGLLPVPLPAGPLEMPIMPMAPPPPPPPSSGGSGIILVILLLAGAGAGAYFYMKSKKKIVVKSESIEAAPKFKKLF